MLLNSDALTLHTRIEKLQNDYFSLVKSSKAKDEKLALVIAKQIISELKSSESVIIEREESREILRKALSYVIAEKPSITIIAKNKNNEVVCIAGTNAKITAIEFAKKTYGIKFKGGGSKDSAEGVII